jgi:integrase/recombinase XerD
VSNLLTKRGQRKYLTPEERGTFIVAAKALKSRLARTYCLTLALTGARISEPLEVTPLHIDWVARTMTLRTLKRRKLIHRIIPVPEDLLEMIELVHDTSQRKKADQRLWDVDRSTAHRWVKEAMRLARLVGPHASAKGLRHGFAIAALDKNVPLNIVSRWLGHSNLQTTAIYGNFTGREERGLAARMWTSAP